MTRTEFYDDPAAPEPNSLVVGVSVAVFDGDGRLLLQQRADSGLWALPGGGLEMRESVAQAGARETLEETGIKAEITGLIGIYSDPRHVIAYDNGEVRRQFNIVLHGRMTGGHLRISDESTQVAFVAPAAIGDLPMHHTQRIRIRHVISSPDRPFIG